MAKRKDILADFTKSLADKPTQTLAPTVAPEAPTPPNPTPAAAPAPAPPPQAEPSRSVERVVESPAKATAPAPARAAVKEVEPDVATKGLGYQKITISLTQADLDLIKSVRLAIGQKGGDLLNTSQLLKVALREMNVESASLLDTITLVKSMDLRRAK